MGSQVEDSKRTDTCPDVQVLLDFVDGALQDAESKSVEQHLLGCSSCQGSVAEAARSDESPEDAVRVWDRYRVEERVGQGAMGTVYVAHDTALDRRVALKILRAPDSLPVDTSSVEASRGAERARAEARALARLKHPNIVEIFDVGLHARGVFISMELLRGPTVRAWLEERERSVDESLDVLLPAARALAAAHDGGVLHRDFKPDNVIRDGATTKVIDFGLASELRQESISHAATVSEPTQTPIAGTPAYMSPEALEGRGGPEADQYAFFVTLHEAVLGRRPFEGTAHGDDGGRRSWPAMFEGPRQRLPGWLADAIARGLDPDPARRFRNMAEAVQVLERGRMRGKRLRTRLAVGGALAIAVAAGAWSPPADAVARLSPAQPASAAVDNAGIALARARFEAGKVASAAHQGARAIAAFEEAHTLAVRHGDDDLAYQAAVDLVFVNTAIRERLVQARTWARYAESALVRQGRDPRGEPALQTALAGIASDAGDFEQALDHLERARALAASPAEEEVAALNVGGALAQLNRVSEAADAFALAFGSRRRRLGLHHPRTLEAGLNEAHARAESGELDRARERLGVLEDALDEESDPALLASRWALEAAIAEAAGDAAAEITARQRGLAVIVDAFEPHDLRTVRQRLLLADALRRSGDCGEALAEIAKGKTALEAAGKSESPTYAELEHQHALTCTKDG